MSKSESHSWNTGHSNGGSHNTSEGRSWGENHTSTQSEPAEEGKTITRGYSQSVGMKDGKKIITHTRSYIETWTEEEPEQDEKEAE